MQWYSAVAIYVLFWVICLFVVLPFGVRTHDELNMEKVEGQADSAPANFKPLQVVLRTTLVSGLAFALFYANFLYGWVSLEDINLYGKGPNGDLEMP